MSDGGSERPVADGRWDPALGGLRVVLIGTGTHISFFGALLAEQGAEVTRVEPLHGDPMRSLGPFVDGASLAWAVAARGSGSFVCDHTRPEGRQLIERLLASSRVMAEARGDGMYDSLLDALDVRGPACRIRFSGTGLGGPRAPELVALAAGGLLEVTGDPGCPPVPFGVAIADHLAAIFGATAAAAVLFAGPAPSQPPVVIDVPTVGAVMRLNEWGFTAADVLGLDRAREGTRPSRVAPLDVYITADGDHVAIVGGSDANFRRLAQAMDADDLLSDSRFSRVESRAANSGEINGMVAEWVRSLPTEAVERRCLHAGVPFSTVASPAQVLCNPQFLARGDFVSVTDPLVGEHLQQAPHPRIENRPAVTPRPAPALGADTAKILQQSMGLTSDEVLHLEREGVVVTGSQRR